MTRLTNTVFFVALFALLTLYVAVYRVAPRVAYRVVDGIGNCVSRWFPGFARSFNAYVGECWHRVLGCDSEGCAVCGGA